MKKYGKKLIFMISKEHKIYLNNIKRQKIIVVFFQICILLFITITWELMARMELINTFIFSSPSLVLNTIYDLALANNLFNHIFITVYETLISFSIASILGILIASIFWWNRILLKIFDPYLTILNSMPKVALGPIIIIWTGANMNSIIIMALLISLIITVMSITESFINTDVNKIKMFKSLGATKYQIYKKLILPINKDNIVSSLKVNISLTLIGVIMGEFLVSKEGIGYLIVYGSQVFNLNLVISGIIILAILATIMYYLLYFLEKKLVK